MSVKRYEGCNFLRQRLVLATLSQRPIIISNIRGHEEAPGLKDYEAGFIRLLDKLTNGSKIEVNVTGTTLHYQPGLIEGGAIHHDCNNQRSIGYYIEPLLMLAPFSKHPFKLTLSGVTHGPDDPSVDYYRYCCLSLMKKLIPDGLVEIKVSKRGVWPDGCGEVLFNFPTVRRMPPLWLESTGKIKRVRGLSYCFKANPGIVNRMVDSSRAVLNKYLPDVYITTDCHQKSKSSGYGLVLVAESTELHITHCAEKSSMVGADSHSETDPQTPMLPEDIGRSTAMTLIEKIVQGGSVDFIMQCVVLLYSALGNRDVSKVRVGPLTDYTIQFLRHMKDFFGVEYKLDTNNDPDDDADDQTVTLTCIGVGFTNINRPTK
jgi:RNA 3'-terminal phosphate cyclase-like protein